MRGNDREIRKRRPHTWSFSLYVALVVVISVAIAVAGISVFGSLLATREFAQANEVLRTQTEAHISESVMLMDAGLNLYDSTLNNRMKEGFVPFIEEYNRSGKNPQKMDLEAVKNRLGGEFELYVISNDSVITETTYPPDHGLNFSLYAPYFVEYLGTIREEGAFHPDRVVTEYTTGNQKKFAYLATPDHRYLLELGLSGTVFLPERSRFRRPMSSIFADIKESNPYITSITIFDTTLRQQTDGKSLPVPNGTLRDRLSRVVATKTGFIEKDPEKQVTYSYFYVNTTDPGYGSDTSRIVEVVYDDGPAALALQDLIVVTLLIGLLAGALGIIGGIIGTGVLTRPIRAMVEDVEVITEGDLHHSVKPPFGWELGELAICINEMVDRLRKSITDLTASREALAESRELYRAVVETQTEFIARLSPEGRILFANNAFLRFSGHSGETLADARFAPAIDDPSARKLALHLVNLTPGHPSATIEYQVQAGDGTKRWVSRTDTALFSPAQEITGYLSVGRDVTVQRETEEQIHRINEELEARVYERTRELERSNRELESFSYTVSHDLRAPLRTIDGFSRILQQDFGAVLPEEVNRYLQRIREGTKNMAHLIDDLLELSRTGRKALMIQEVDVARVVRDCLSGFAPEVMERGVKITTGDLPPAQADPILVYQVFFNLIDNALKFTAHAEEAGITVGSFQKDGKIVYYVRDNGIGFDMKYRDKVFGVFERLNPAEEYEGTGVGLAIVKQIIERHGGEIWTESAPGAGAAFFFTFG